MNVPGLPPDFLAPTLDGRAVPLPHSAAGDGSHLLDTYLPLDCGVSVAGIESGATRRVGVGFKSRPTGTSDELHQSLVTAKTGVPSLFTFRERRTVGTAPR